MIDDVPRRHKLYEMTPAERAIFDAVQLVETMGADVRLTDAVILLAAARDSVADYVDGIDCRRSVATEPRPPAAAVDLLELAEWLERFRASIEKNQHTADLFMQEVSGLEVWAQRLRAALAAPRE